MNVSMSLQDSSETIMDSTTVDGINWTDHSKSLDEQDVNTMAMSCDSK